MSFLHANLLCLALVLIDLVARTWRLQWILRGMRFRVSFLEVLTLNTVGDAASAATPLRLAGEPTRLLALVYARVPAAASVVAIVAEAVAIWPVVVAAAGWLALIYAPRWWRTAEPQLASTLRHAWVVLSLLVVGGLIAWYALRRFAPHASAAMRTSTRRMLVYTRRIPAWSLAASVPLTLASLAARVAILPVLMLTLPRPAGFGALSFASFLLVYGQLLLPTPSGAGVVELGFVGGMVSGLGHEHAGILLLWRFYTTFVLVGLGALLGLQRYGRAALGLMLRGRAAPRTPSP